MKKIYLYLARTLKKTYWCSVAWLGFLFALVISASLLVSLPESLLLLGVLVVSFALPTLLLNVLGVIALVQAVKQQRRFIGAIGYVFGGLVFDVFFVFFFFLAIIAIFGFV